MGLQPLRFVYGITLIALLFVHFGVYHSFSEPSVMGILWGYYLPIGYIGLALGLLVIFYPKIAVVKKLGFGLMMAVIGFVLVFSLLLSPKDFFVNLLHNTSLSSGYIDIDYAIGNWLVWALTLFSITLAPYLK